ncbi:MAG: UDP-2,3-diacylglucosamine hydrolase [marine bacterium B5-7]|nr:MAG: UDP-2,3-diacylglucosamine hydrolase [marine bacterium B5-7]
MKNSDENRFVDHSITLDGTQVTANHFPSAQYMTTDTTARIQLGDTQRAEFISDLHLGAEHPDIAQRFKAWLGHHGKNNENNLDVLFILGDLFEFWIGDDAAETCGYSEMVELLERFTDASGCTVYLMHGNRDFLIGNDFCQQTGCTLLPDPCYLEISGHTILLSHGDAYCTDDTEHQQFRQMVHNPQWQSEFLSKSINERLAYAHEARRISESGKSSKSMDIMDVSAAAIDDALRQHDCRIMIHGHTHRPAIHSLDVDGKPAYRVVLGAWFDESNSLEVNSYGITYLLDGLQKIEFNTLGS